jgi:hypothetical protein
VSRLRVLVVSSLLFVSLFALLLSRPSNLLKLFLGRVDVRIDVGLHKRQASLSQPSSLSLGSLAKPLLRSIEFEFFLN